MCSSQSRVYAEVEEGSCGLVCRDIYYSCTGSVSESEGARGSSVADDTAYTALNHLGEG